jgi:hypothetical protein
VLCPFCNEKVEIPANAVGPNRTDPWNVVRYEECSVSFDYDDDDVASDREPSGAEGDIY